MTAALALSIAPEAAQATALREHVQVLEPRRGVREVLLVTDGRAQLDAQHAIIVLAGGGGGFAVTSTDGVPRVHGGLPAPQRQRLAHAVGGAIVELSPPTDRPVMDRAWRLSDSHIEDLRAAVDWTRGQWPFAQTWVMGFRSGTLSAAVATASIDELAGAVLLSCVDEALEQPQKCERMRVLAVRQRSDADETVASIGSARGRKTLVTVRDERHAWADGAAGDSSATRFGGKEHQVVDVVARWILTGTAPDEIR